jgi:FkbM family methyltransferase
MSFYSQQDEDRILFEKYLNYEDGFFIELGAMDGVMYSNTLFFENNLRWKGVLIEPTNQYNSLIQNRPNCYNFNYAISENKGFVEFLGDGALGGMTHTMSDKHRIGWNLDQAGPTYSVQSIPISELLSTIDIKKVDFFSIDVEGGELEVLHTFDWNIPVYIVLIEINQDLDKNQKCRDFLISKGFEFDMEIGCNEVWINKKNK